MHVMSSSDMLLRLLLLLIFFSPVAIILCVLSSPVRGVVSWLAGRPQCR